MTLTAKEEKEANVTHVKNQGDAVLKTKNLLLQDKEGTIAWSCKEEGTLNGSKVATRDRIDRREGKQRSEFRQPSPKHTQSKQEEPEKYGFLAKPTRSFAIGQLLTHAL